MQQLGKITARALAQLRESSELPGPDSDRSLLVWNGLVEMFGSGVIREYGETPPRLWSEAISSLSDDDLRRGFSALMKQRRQYAPNLTEFVAACQKVAEPLRYASPPPSPEAMAAMLPAPPERRASQEKIKAHLENMRKLFR